MNYIPQLLHVSYGYDHGQAASLGGVAQGGSVIGLLVVGNMCYKSLRLNGKVGLVLILLVVCTVVPLVLALGPAVLPRAAVVPLAVLWGLAYALPFYIPPGEFAMQVRASPPPPVSRRVGSPALTGGEGTCPRPLSFILPPF